MADACVYLMNLPDEKFVPLLGQDRNDGLPPLMNIGVGHDLSIRELAETMKDVVGYQGAIEFDTTQARRHPAQADGRGAAEWHGVAGAVPQWKAGWLPRMRISSPATDERLAPVFPEST